MMLRPFRLMKYHSRRKSGNKNPVTDDKGRGDVMPTDVVLVRNERYVLQCDAVICTVCVPGRREVKWETKPTKPDLKN